MSKYISRLIPGGDFCIETLKVNKQEFATEQMIIALGGPLAERKLLYSVPDRDKGDYLQPSGQANGVKVKSRRFSEILTGCMKDNFKGEGLIIERLRCKRLMATVTLPSDIRNGNVHVM